MITDNNVLVSLLPPLLEPAHKQLDIFVGTWCLDGQNNIGAPIAPGVRVTGEETYEWLPGGFFLVCRWDRYFGSNEHKGVGIIGYDESTQGYASNNFDSLGYSRRYQVSECDGCWMFSGKWERATLVFTDDGCIMTANWEISSDGSNWLPLCELKATKAG